MKIISIEPVGLPAFPPVAMTIGNFDGVHLGHVAVLKHLKNFSQQHGVASLVITFTSHPTEVLRPDKSVTKLTTLSQKCDLIEQQGIDFLLLLDFSPAFATQNVEEFFTTLIKQIPLTHCILGHDAVLGHNRSGTREEVQRVASHLGFTVEYLPPLLVDHVPVSSSLIRQLIANSRISEAEKLLGRKYDSRN